MYLLYGNISVHFTLSLPLSHGFFLSLSTCSISVLSFYPSSLSLSLLNSWDRAARRSPESLLFSSDCLIIVSIILSSPSIGCNCARSAEFCACMCFIHRSGVIPEPISLSRNDTVTRTWKTIPDKAWAASETHYQFGAPGRGPQTLWATRRKVGRA